MEKHNKIAPPMGSTQYLASSKLEDLEDDAVNTAEGEAA